MTPDATVEGIDCNGTYFKVGDHVEGKTKLNRVVRGPITCIHPAVDGEHTAQVQIKSHQTVIICELVRLSRAKKV